MQWLDGIERFFNNQSVGAFLGAFVAYFLVMLNDARRERRKVQNIRAEIEVCRANTAAKLETVRRNRALLKEEGRTMPAPILRFEVTLIRQLSAEVRDRLTLDQRRAVEGLCYTMEAIDELLRDAYEVSRRFTGPMGQAERLASGEILKANLADAVVNLKRLVEMCDNYVAGQYAVIVTKQYDRLQYEEA
jgi:hypothetical protein